MQTSTQQPNLRSFIVYDRLPEGCVAYPVTTTDCAPHLRPGDIAIIDPAECEPAVGELFVIQWSGGRTNLVETWSRALTAGSGPDGEMIDTVCWFVGSSNRPRSREECIEWLSSGRRGGWMDGPYATEGPGTGYLASKLRGRVVGILEPSFAEPLRLANAEGC